MSALIDGKRQDKQSQTRSRSALELMHRHFSLFSGNPSSLPCSCLTAAAVFTPSVHQEQPPCGIHGTKRARFIGQIGYTGKVCATLPSLEGRAPLAFVAPAHATVISCNLAFCRLTAKYIFARSRTVISNCDSAEILRRHAVRETSF